MRYKILITISAIVAVLAISIYALPNIVVIYRGLACTEAEYEVANFWRLPTQLYCIAEIKKCSKQGKTFIPAIQSLISTKSLCVKIFNDAHKSCTDSQQCEGQCFARINFRTKEGNVNLPGKCQQHDQVQSTPGCFIPIEEIEADTSTSCWWTWV